ncbi:MAG: alpha/beta hydrolase [Phycisphaerales bacterium]|nr:alpha/beta hydrolase [Phycisphaerales bacterium]
MKSKCMRITTLGLTILLACASQAAAQDQFFESAGVKLRYIERGQGEPVVLIHGFSGSAETGWIFNGVLPALAPEYRVIALDCRGHGGSDKPHEPDKYGAEMAEDVVRLLDHLKIERAHLVGYSMGGLITLKVELTHPQRVISAIPGGYGWPEGGRPAGKEFMTRLAESLEQGKGVGPLMEALTPADRPKMTEEQIAAVNTMVMRNNDALALAAVVRGFKGLEADEKLLRANKVPTLSIIGGIDPLKVDVDRLAGVMGSHKVVTIDGADHAMTMFRPEFLASIKEFLAQHRLTPPPAPSQGGAGLRPATGPTGL